MPIAIDTRSSWFYVLVRERDLDEEKQTRFELRPLACGELAKIEDHLASFSAETGEARMLSGTQTLGILRAGLVGWENFPDRNGNDVSFSGTKRKLNGVEIMQPDDSALDRLTPQDRRELAQAIAEQTRLTEEQRGN